MDIICFERGNCTRPSKSNMPAVPSNVWDRVVPFVAKLWNPLLPNANDPYVPLNNLLQRENSFLLQQSLGFAELYDMLQLTTINDKSSCGYNFLKALEFETARTIDTTKYREDCLCSSIMKRLAAFKSPFLLRNPYQSFPKNLLESITLTDILMASSIVLPSKAMDSQVVPMLPSTLDVEEPAGHICTDQKTMPDKELTGITPPVNEELKPSIVMMPSPPSIGVCAISSQKGKRFATMENMNNQLIQRKSQKMNKNTKKRRRRQKKQKQNTVKVLPEIPKGPTALKDIESETDDDSDHLPDITISIECLEAANPQTSPSNVSFFFEQVIDSGTDEEWDYADGYDVNTVIDDFEFPGLSTALSSIHISSHGPSIDLICEASLPNKKAEFCHISIIEIELSSALKEVNSRWQKMMSNVSSAERKPSKVTFARDEELIMEHPVEVYDRKGEWEIYATERFRFRRRIEEVEKILAPVLMPAHRQKIQEQHKGKKQS